MFNSLRTRLLIWQVLLLTAVVVSFGSVVFYQWRQNLFSELDAELLSSATVLEGTLRGAYTQFQSEGHRPPPPDHRPPPPDHRPPQRGNQYDAESREGRIILAGEVAPEIFDLPHNLNVNTDQSRSTYFVIYDMNDQIVANSVERAFRNPATLPNHQKFEFIGSQRELVITGPGETRILVGRDIGDFNKQSISFLLKLSLAGLGILVVACVAGYWVTGRAIAPIRKVSDTVQTISGTNVHRRIDVSEMDSEFFQLSTLLNQMLDRLESTIKQQLRFITDASHELRTPVSVIGLHSELALSQERTAEEYKKTFQICLRASNRLKSLTEDLLALAKSDAGQLQSEWEELDLSQLASESIEFLKPLADQQQVSLANESQSIARVQGDRRLLRQLIDNLLANAIVHNQKGGIATVSVQSNGNGTTLRVRDNGPGIPENELPNLFDRFYRVSKSRSRESGGSGLGLSICQSIARIHGGELSVRSQPGNGTVFELSLQNDSNRPPDDHEATA